MHLRRLSIQTEIKIFILFFSVSSGDVMLVRVSLLMWQWNEKGAECAQIECSNKVNYIFYFAWFWRMGYVITSEAAGTGVVAEQNSCKLRIQFI